MRNTERLGSAKQAIVDAINHSTNADADAAAEGIFAAELTLRRRGVGRPDLARCLEEVLMGDVTTTDARTELREVAQKIDAELDPTVTTASFVPASDGGVER